MPDARLKQLESVARMYYEEGLNQAQIATRLNVSRPWISRMLNQAKSLGIVEVKVHTITGGETVVLAKAVKAFGLKGGFLVPVTGDDTAVDQRLVEGALSLIEDLHGGHLGLGWGHIIGTMVSVLEAGPPRTSSITDVCPMVGNRGVPIRHYHSSENTRIVAQQTNSHAHYLYTPAIAESQRELDLLRQTDHYRTILEEWNRLDIALVNIGNYPSTPDIASGARFGHQLSTQNAVGRLVAYYYDISGHIIHSEYDYAIQIPLDSLQRCTRIVGLCSSNTNKDALEGALNTGFLTHIVAPDPLVGSLLEPNSSEAISNLAR